MTDLNAIFTPNSVPTLTYVDRSGHDFEKRLKDAFNIRNFVVSVSGPSKTGKSVLIKRVLDEDYLIPISGINIKSPNDLWFSVLDWMDVPTTISSTRASGSTQSAGGTVGARVDLPLLGGINSGGNVTKSSQKLETSTEEKISNPFQQVIREISGSEFIIFIDDFHYIPKEMQPDIGKEIKSMAEQGVKICTASVPHRSDDVVRSNHELRGRVSSIDIPYWENNELNLIAKKGFSEINLDIDNKIIEKFVTESFGSPQLMQAICLNFCLELGVSETQDRLTKPMVSENTTSQSLQRTSYFSDYSSVLAGLHSGPKQRGTERKQFSLSDDSSGDVYRCVLLALNHDPAKLSFTYDDMIGRVRSVCIGDAPVGSSVSQALLQMEKIAEQLSPGNRIIEWDEDVLDIVEPYFLFYLRCSKKLSHLS